MAEQELKALLKQLQETLEETETVDEETLQMVTELEDDLDRLLDQDNDENDFDSLKERAQSLEAQFAAEYPATERFFREIIDLLAKVGI